jgi:hypothetical protein
MDIIPFIKKNDLWYIDLPELVEYHLTFIEPTFISERNMIELLDTLAKRKLNQMNLEFHYDYINPYDVKLERSRNTFKCVSIFYKEKDLLVDFPPILSRAMKSYCNTKKIYIRLFPIVVNE